MKHRWTFMKKYGNVLYHQQFHSQFSRNMYYWNISDQSVFIHYIALQRRFCQKFPSVSLIVTVLWSHDLPTPSNTSIILYYIWDREVLSISFIEMKRVPYPLNIIHYLWLFSMQNHHSDHPHQSLPSLPPLPLPLHHHHHHNPEVQQISVNK